MNPITIALFVGCLLAVPSCFAVLPNIPPDFQSDFIQRISSNAGTVTVSGHIYSDDLHNRTRFDYTVSGTAYSMWDFIKESTMTETRFLILRPNSVCYRTVTTWSGNPFGLCTTWMPTGTKYVNGQSCVGYIANCTFAIGGSPYATEWLFLAGTNPPVPFEYIIQGGSGTNRYYSEIDYAHFVIGTGSTNATVFNLPSQCGTYQPRAEPKLLTESLSREQKAEKEFFALIQHHTGVPKLV